MLANIRPESKKFFKVIAKPFAWLGFSPNAVTLLSIPLALIAAYFIAIQNFALGLLFVILASAMDALDGALAELLNKKTLFGNYLDAMVDRFAETAVFLGFLFLYPLPAFLALAFSTTVSYAKARAGLVVITDNRDWPGIGERSERLVLLMTGLLVSIFLPKLFGFATMEIFLWLIVALTFIGSINRLFFGRRLIEESEKKGLLLPYLKKKK